MRRQLVVDICLQNLRTRAGQTVLSHLEGPWFRCVTGKRPWSSARKHLDAFRVVGKLMSLVLWNQQTQLGHTGPPTSPRKKATATSNTNQILLNSDIYLFRRRKVFLFHLSRHPDLWSAYLCWARHRFSPALLHSWRAKQTGRSNYHLLYYSLFNSTIRMYASMQLRSSSFGRSDILIGIISNRTGL